MLHITPAKEGVLALIRKAGTLIRKHVSAPIPILIKRYWTASGRKHRFAVRAGTASGKQKAYEVIKVHAIGIRLLAAMSARELRAMRAAA